LARNLLISIPTGLDKGAYGINAVPVTITPTKNAQQTATTLSSEDVERAPKREMPPTDLIGSDRHLLHRRLTGDDSQR
jgi:hypothetical protein